MLIFFKKVYGIFGAQEKKKLLFLTGLMFLLACFEFLGIASLLPYIKILSDQQIVLTNKHLHALYVFLGFLTVHNFLIFLGVMIFGVIFIRTFLAVLNTYAQAKFSETLNNRLSQQCLYSYMNMPYSEAILKNSSILSKHLLIEVVNTTKVISSLLLLITNLLTSVALIGLMILVNPFVVLLVISGSVTFSGLLFASIKKVVSRKGKEAELCSRQMFKASHEALGGLKDIKSYHVENYFSNKFLNAVYKYGRINIYFSMLSAVPSNLMNLFGFGALFTVLLYLLFVHGSLVSILPIIAIAGLSLQRLLPATTIIFNSIAAIRRNLPGFYIIQDAIRDFNKTNKSIVWANNISSEKNPDRLEFHNRLAVKNLSYIYPKTSIPAISNLSFELKKGGSLGIVGMSGAGKSTLVDVLIGLLAGFEGNIYCDDIKITSQNRRLLTSLIGYVPQQTFLIDGSVLENVAFGLLPEQIDIEKVNSSLKIAQLDDFVKDLPNGLESPIGERGVRISGGQRQRLGIARALYRDPEILIMDEATSSLDTITEQEFNAALKALLGEKTLILIAHRYTSIRFCDNFILLDHGKLIASGTHDDLIRDSKKFRELYLIN